MTDTGDATLVAFCQAREARRASILARGPPIGRTELISPYTDKNGNVIYTEDQLSMQRKIMILRYNKDAPSRKKIDKYIRAVQQTTPISRSQVQQLVQGDIDCSADDLIPTPNTGMDVPGPYMLFTYDPSIPLYNYKVAR